MRRIQYLERTMQIKFTKGVIPSGEQVCEKRLSHFITEVKD